MLTGRFDMLTRRHLIALAAAEAATTSFPAHDARAQTPGDFPARPVSLIVPVAAGGPNDIVARMLGDKLSSLWGQPVVVENKAGAGTNIGNEYVARSNPDGYTILFGTASLAVNPSLYRAINYDPIADLAPVSLVSQLAYFMFVPNSSRAHSVQEFIESAKFRPGKLTMGSPGTGSAPYLAEMLFLQMADIQMTHVPYRGAAPAFTDLIAGRLDCYFGSGTLLSYAQSGQVRVLATTGPKRDAAAPDVPTLAEAGVPGYEVTAWQALFVPARTPARLVRQISVDTITALDDPAIKAKLAKSGYMAGGCSPEQLDALVKSEIAKWRAVVTSLGLKIN
jgi:tripartite-type tricarboxylate transporter receptor subunit TctC